MTKVVVIGDPMLDVWTDLVSTRPNPENLSTQVVRHERTVVCPGGALNVAVNCAALGLATTFLNVSPFDISEHRRVRDLLAQHHVNLNGAIADTTGHYLTRKKRVRVDGELLYREDNDHHILRSLSVTQVLDALHALEPDVLVLVDYGKGALWPPGITAGLLRLTKMYNVLLDVKPELLRFLSDNKPGVMADVTVKCNSAEWAKADAAKDPRAWVNALSLNALYLTCAAGGAIVVTPQSIKHKVPTTRDGPTNNVCGAGDVFTAALAYQLSEHWTGRQQAGRVAVDIATRTVRGGQRNTLITESYAE